MTNRYTLSDILEKHLPRGARLLDFGCANGHLFNQFSALGIKEIYGVDTDPQFKAENITITSDSIAYLSEHKEYFDVIFSRQVLYYFERHEQDELFKSLYEALKPEGMLLVVVYNGAVFTSHWIFQKDIRQKMIFNEVSLQKLAKDNNFIDNLILGVKPIARTKYGTIILSLFQSIVQVKYTILYFLERGKDPFRPRHFTPDIALIAKKGTKKH